MMLIRRLVACLPLLALLACQPVEQSNQTRLFAEVYVRYLETERNVLAQISLLEGDSLHNAEPAILTNGVFFQDIPMEARTLPTDLIRYQVQTSIPYPDTFHFRIRPDEGGEIKLGLHMEPLGPYQINGEVSKSSGLDISAPGSQLDERDNLVLLFSDANDKAQTIILKGPTEGMRHRFRPAQMERMAVGPQELYLVKKREFSLQKESLNAHVVMEYYSRNADIEVVK